MRFMFPARFVAAALGLGAVLVFGSACHHASGNGDPDMSVDDAGFSDDGGMACATQSSKAELAPLDILLLLDTSASMDYEGKWTSVKSAIRSFVKNPQAVGLGLGLQYYPLRLQCNRAAYADPAVALQVLPLGQQDISDSLAIQQMSGGTPMVPALEGSFNYLKKWATDNATHKVVLVLASDGAPDDTCIADSPMGRTNSLANAALTASDAFGSDPKISTFVIGVGTETAVLEQIATAGGGKAIFVDTNTDVQGAFLAALNEIRGNALTCEFAIPDSNGAALDYDHVNVIYTPSPTMPGAPLVYVETVDKCAQAPNNGWYYDDPAVPTKVVLCKDACSTVTSGAEGRIDVVFGCKTLIL